MKDVYELFFVNALSQRISKGNKRELMQKNPKWVDFSSNDYLGMAHSLKLWQEIQCEYTKIIQQNQTLSILGSTGSRLLTGNREYIENLELEIAKFHGAESCLIFNSGYAANVGLLSSIASKDDCFIIDSQVHASTRAGIQLSGAKKLTFGHNNLNQLEALLKRASRISQKIFVCVESLYSMSGEVAPLKEIGELTSKYFARLIVDEAHATGILGQNGEGLVVDQGLQKNVFARVHTFGKALGVYGAAIVGSSLLREYLINFSKSFIYTTALPLYNYVAIHCAYQKIKNANKERQSLSQLIRYFQLQVQALNLPLKTTKSAIQFIPAQNAKNVDALVEKFIKLGLDVRGIKAPTIRRGGEGLRVCLHAFNLQSEIDLMLRQLQQEKLEIWAA